LGKVRQLTQQTQKTLNKFYYNPTLSSSLGGYDNLKHKTRNIPSGEVKEWLSSQDAYTLHKKVNRKFLRRPTIVNGSGIQYQADLIDMQKYSDENSGYKYILSVIDVFSKFGWCLELRTKNGREVSGALEEILTSSPCEVLQTDKGKEFYNASVRNLLQKLRVRHFSTENDDIKASIVERFNRTIQSKLYRWFTYTNSNKWSSVLRDITTTYNNTRHSATKVSPNDVKQSNPEDIWLNLYAQHSLRKYKKNQLCVNDFVRISKYKHIFAKGYDKNWSAEIFVIDKIEQTNPVTYRIRDQKDEKIHGTYYADELQKVVLPKSFIIDDILSERKVGRGKEYFVSYRGYPSKFNEWISSKQLTKL
jgi:hypothetical protein